MNEPDHDGTGRAAAGAGGEDRGFPKRSRHRYEIRVKGHLNRQWSDWLGGLEMRLLDNGEMILSGPIADQAALMGILNKLVGLNLALLAFRELQAEGTEEP